MTTLREIYPALTGRPGADTDIRRLPSIRRVYAGVYGSILMACVKTQTKLLVALWKDRFASPEIVRKIVRELAEEGKVPELLDVNSKYALELMEERYSRYSYDLAFA